jgi:hypothetical protein
MRSLIGIVFLLAQLFSIVYVQFGPARYFCWAPNDYMVSYDLRVKINNRILTPQEVERRYRLPQTGVYQNIATHLIDHLRQYETTYGRKDHSQVTMTYSTNGRQQEEWTWPQQ